MDWGDVVSSTIAVLAIIVSVVFGVRSTGIADKSMKAARSSALSGQTSADAAKKSAEAAQDQLQLSRRAQYLEEAPDFEVSWEEPSRGFWKLHITMKSGPPSIMANAVYVGETTGRDHDGTEDGYTTGGQLRHPQQMAVPRTIDLDAEVHYYCIHNDIRLIVYSKEEGADEERKPWAFVRDLVWTEPRAPQLW